MQQYLKFYIDGEWVDPTTPNTFDVINPATEEAFAQISLGSSADVDSAVAAAKAAFPAYSKWSVHERVKLLEQIIKLYTERSDEIATACHSKLEMRHV